MACTSSSRERVTYVISHYLLLGSIDALVWQDEVHPYGASSPTPYTHTFMHVYRQENEIKLIRLIRAGTAPQRVVGQRQCGIKDAHARARVYHA